jgi:hypothetical protein
MRLLEQLLSRSANWCFHPKQSHDQPNSAPHSSRSMSDLKGRECAGLAAEGYAKSLLEVQLHLPGGASLQQFIGLDEAGALAVQPLQPIAGVRMAAHRRTVPQVLPAEGLELPQATPSLLRR